jgi:hypothetical protein
MALNPATVELIRYEIGPDTDVADDNVLITSLIVWRTRLSAMQARSFDITKEGNWLARSQRVKYLRERVERQAQGEECHPPFKICLRDFKLT